MDYNYQVDIRALRKDELVMILLRLGMRVSMVKAVFPEFGTPKIKTMAGWIGVKPVSGRLPVGGLYYDSIYGTGNWNAFSRYRAIPFFESWLKFKTAQLDDTRAFILAWQEAGGGILNINWCWVLAQQTENLEIKTCRCGEKFLRERWMFGRHQCQFCSGEFLLACHTTKFTKFLSREGDDKEEVLRCLQYLEHCLTERYTNEIY